MTTEPLLRNAWLTDQEQFEHLLREVYERSWGEIWLYNHDLAIFRDYNWFEKLYVNIINREKRICENIIAIKVLLPPKEFRLFKSGKDSVIIDNLRRLSTDVQSKFHIANLETVLSKIRAPRFLKAKRANKYNVWVFYTTYGELSSRRGIVILRQNYYPFSEARSEKQDEKSKTRDQRIAICWRLEEQEELGKRLEAAHFASCFKENKNFVHIKMVHKKTLKIDWGNGESRGTVSQRKAHLQKKTARIMSLPVVVGKADTVVLAALQEEISYFGKLVGEGCRIEGQPGAFYACISEETGKTTDLVYSHIGTMGNTPAAIRTSQILRRFNPRCLFLIGIAAGIQATEKQLRFCDIIVADHVLAYEYKKIIRTFAELKDQQKAISRKQKPAQKRRQRTREQPSFPSYNCSGELVRAAGTLMETYNRRANDYVSDKCCRNENKGENKRIDAQVPRVFSGTVASGNKVVADEKILRDIRRFDRKTIALEMEGEGVLAAAENHYSKVHAILVKGVSDYGDKTKVGDEKDKYKLWAAENAAGFVYELIRKSLHRIVP